MEGILKKLEDLSVDEFLLSGFDAFEGNESEDEVSAPEDETDNSVSQEKSLKNKGKASQHKDQLSRLKSTDPEFYKFLQDNDQKLLNFDDTDSSEDDEEEKYHKLPSQLEVASSDEEVDEKDEKKVKKSSKKATKVTAKMIEDWKTALKKEPTPRLVRDITQAFKAAVATTKGDKDIECRYSVDDSSVFNALILFCIKDMHGALNKLLNFKAPDREKKKLILPSSSPRWQKNQLDIKMYLSGLVQLLSSLTQSTVITAVLRHANQMVPYFLCVPKQARHLLKQLIKQWSTGEETVRVLAFLAINKICRQKQNMFLNTVLKQMYIAYVQNCKFTSPNALPLINFMQRTLAEMYSLDTQVSYQHGFIYIRQLAIHLRNAMNMKKKETYQSVYNWQYVHCLHLWCRVLSTIYPSEVLEPLIYPLCQVIVGCIKLVPISRYYPLRLHCVRALILLSSSTETFVPVLPFLLEILQQEDFNKKPGRMSVKPINFAVILKLSKTNLQEKAFKDGLIEQLYDLILEYFHTQAATIGFPELALPTIIQLKAFLKECKVANYCKQIRQLLEKVQENCSHITSRRQRAAFGVADTTAVAAWEKQVAEEGTPLTRYYSQWKKLREKEIQLEISGKERMEDLNLPEIKRKKIQEKKEDKKEFKGLFESDSDSDSGELMQKRKDSDDDEGLEDLSDMSGDDDDDDDASDGEDDSDGSEEAEERPSGSKSKAPKQVSSVKLQELAEGDEDMVEDLELSDQD
ncbi:nucleolar complex protein 2 homolog isoform X2 [Pangasianodon hypophthalmus]|uniref:nucleolar complex protein 2 homolog isoform X2 n=1 Tax=Pangasianodon hypophthalmus TaxID=310915 RepID=UPI00147DC7E9|nr:nucleolar complex protein 2 homolog isoform X2 [Pangasianodon hypophthalmus]